MNKSRLIWSWNRKNQESSLRRLVGSISAEMMFLCWLWLAVRVSGLSERLKIRMNNKIHTWLDLTKLWSHGMWRAVDQKGVQGPRRSEKCYTGDDIGAEPRILGLDAAIPQQNVNIWTFRTIWIHSTRFLQYFWSYFRAISRVSYTNNLITASRQHHHGQHNHTDDNRVPNDLSNNNREHHTKSRGARHPTSTTVEEPCRHLGCG